MNPDETLDLKGVACPNNFVKAKLRLEEMRKGQTLEVVLDNGEPIKNVPRALKEEGHQIVKVEKINEHWKIVVKKQ